MDKPTPPRFITKDHPHLLTKAAYAAACGVSRQAIEARLAAGSLTTETVPGAGERAYVNTRTYPPGRAAGHSRRAPGLPPLPRRAAKPRPV